MTGVYIISAPSGSGKSTLVNKVREIVPGLKFSISYTTRASRGDEQNGREYYFVSKSEFEEMVRKDEFLAHYHRRSNVESTVMMIKSKFGDAVRSKSDVAAKNEVLCKFLCHNICCLISAMYELGIDPVLTETSAHKINRLPTNSGEFNV